VADVNANPHGGGTETGHETRAAYFATAGTRADLRAYLRMRRQKLATGRSCEGQFYERIAWQTGRMQTSTRKTKHVYEGRFYERHSEAPPDGLTVHIQNTVST